MKKLESTLPNILLSLIIVCSVAGAALAATHSFTEKTIAVAMEAELHNAIKFVIPEFDNDPVKEKYKASVTGSDSLTIYPATKDGKTVGFAVESYTKNGFSGMIRIMAGFSSDGKLNNFSVLEHNETPGLGDKMQKWFRTDKNKQNILGKDMTKGGLKVTKDGGDVDAITAATITSRAFLEAVNLAYSTCSGNSDAVSGATTGSSENIDATSGATDTSENKETKIETIESPNNNNN